jgi:hypothetical protein
MSARGTRWIGLYAAAAAAAAVVLSPLLALSYFATDGGAEELQNPTVSAWADPARDLVGGLLIWAPPERVYASYVQAFAVLFPAVFLCARAIRARRSPTSGVERWGWRIGLVGYGLASVALLAAFMVLFSRAWAEAALNVIFLLLMLPGMFVSVIGSTVLGISFLRSRHFPKLAAWLLTLAFPSMLVVPAVLGHNSLGMVPLIVAWGTFGLRLWRERDQVAAGEFHPSHY